MSCNCALIECVACNAKGIFFDYPNLKDTDDLLINGKDNIVFSDINKMIQDLKSYKKNPMMYKKLGDWSNMIDSIDPFRDEKGNVIQDADNTGELIYKGDNVMMGYAENYHDLAKGDENKGILHTGDLAKRDTDGFYYITGRKDRYVKIHGNRINLAELEYIISDFGIQSLCQLEKENQITIFIKN